ncbi:MAG: hypothetical protein E7299_05170 [Lachnospiraceae bacterium]|nr:hypothetical protein [Lachnospiraceae bacterium]
MKKKTIHLFFFICLIILLTGCSAKESVQSEPLSAESQIDALQETEKEEMADEQDEQLEEAVWNAIEETDAVLEKAHESEDSQEFEQVVVETQQTEFSPANQSELEQVREKLGLSEKKIPGLKAAQERNYYYSCLDAEEQILYVELYQILANMEKGVMLTTKDANRIPHVYQAVLNDHPELFYTKGFEYTKATMEGEIIYITCSGSYTYTKEEASVRMQQIEEAAQKILGKLPSDADAYTVVKSLYEYIILNTDYGEKTKDHQNISSVLLDNVSVCNGYAKTLQFLLNKKGIPCILVNGSAKGNHAWNIVSIDGEYYCVDATWGDPSYNTDSDKTIPAAQIDYSYLCVPKEQLGMDHTESEEFPLPDCQSMKANYFVREGLYITGYDEAYLKTVFDTALQRGQKSIVLKASDRQVYETLKQKLFKEQAVFQYLGANAEGQITSLAYSQNENMYTISIWY